MNDSSVDQYIDNIQAVVDAAEVELDVKKVYQRYITKYSSEINPQLYCLRGDDYKKEKSKMREYALNQVSSLANRLLTIRAENMEGAKNEIRNDSIDRTVDD